MTVFRKDFLKCGFSIIKLSQIIGCLPGTRQTFFILRGAGKAPLIVYKSIPVPMLHHFILGKDNIRFGIIWINFKDFFYINTLSRTVTESFCNHCI